jgi:hypothetical protein
VNNKALQTKKSAVKRRKPGKIADTHRIIQREEILDGAVTLIRTTKSGQYWLAREEYHDLRGKIRSGNKIFSITAKELVTDFIKFKANEAKSDIITEGRVISGSTFFQKGIFNHNNASDIAKSLYLSRVAKVKIGKIHK